MSTYFIPTDSIYIASFYNKACVVPKKYLATSRNDLQDSFPSYLLITKHSNIKYSDCCIEAILTEDEERNLIQVNNRPDFFLLKYPIPISRILCIHFKSNEIREKIVAMVNLGSGFLPFEKTAVINQREREFEFIYQGSISKENIDFGRAIETFNSILGGFALLKTAGESYMNYSESYFPTLSNFNSLIKSDLEQAGLETKSWLSDAFFGRDRFKSLHPYLHKIISENDLQALAAQEKQIINKNNLTGIIDLESLDKMTYVLAVLYTYGVGEEAKKNKVDSLIVNNFNVGIKPKFSEIIALCYGLNRGYSLLSNEYQISDKKKRVKYRLESKLDVYTVESIYQYAFYNSTSNSYFTYLDKYLTYKGDLSRKAGTTRILGESVVLKKKPKVGSSEYIMQLSQTFFQKTAEIFFQQFLAKVISTVKSDIDTEYADYLSDRDFQINRLELRTRESKNLNDELLHEMRLKDEQLNILKKEIEKLKLNLSPINVNNSSSRKLSQKDTKELDSVREANYRLLLLFDQIRMETNAKKIKLMINEFGEVQKESNK